MDKLKDKLQEGTYTFNSIINSLCINAKITHVTVLKDRIVVFFYDGSLEVYIDHIEEIKEPSSVWCYRIKNRLGDDIGFIHKLKE